MRPESNSNAVLKDKSLLTSTHETHNGEDSSGQKFYCTEYDKEVEREDCLNCVKWDDCPEREQGANLIGAMVLVVAIVLIITSIFIFH